MSNRAAELGRLGASDGNTAVLGIPDEVQTIWLVNALTAPVWMLWGFTTQDPPAASATEWDTAAPGSAITVIPVPEGAQTVRMTVDYPGAVPVADVQAVAYGTRCAFPPSTSLLDT